MTIATQSIAILAKILLTFYFLKAGINNALNYKKLVNVLRFKNIPFPALSLILVIIAEIFGSLMIIFNFYAIIGAAMLIVFTVAANLFFCNYWTMQGADKRNVGFLFYSNLAVIGGLLLVTILILR